MAHRNPAQAVRDLFDNSAEPKQAKEESGPARKKARKPVQTGAVLRAKSLAPAVGHVVAGIAFRHRNSNGFDLRSSLRPHATHHRHRRKPVQTASHADTEAQFELFWSIYPQRVGTNLRKPAFIKFKSLVEKEKVSPEIIIRGAQRYAASVADLEGSNRKYIKQAVTWLNQEGWTGEYRKPERPIWWNSGLQAIHDEVFGADPAEGPDPNLADIDLAPDEWTRD
jgi:hypothetical protein